MSIIAFLCFDCTLLSYLFFIRAFVGSQIVHGIFNNSQTDRHSKKEHLQSQGHTQFALSSQVNFNFHLVTLLRWDSLKEFQRENVFGSSSGIFLCVVAFCRHGHKLKPIKNAQYEYLSFLLQKKIMTLATMKMVITMK